MRLMPVTGRAPSTESADNSLIEDNDRVSLVYETRRTSGLVSNVNDLGPLREFLLSPGNVRFCLHGSHSTNVDTAKRSYNAVHTTT